MPRVLTLILQEKVTQSKTIRSPLKSLNTKEIKAIPTISSHILAFPAISSYFKPIPTISSHLKEFTGI